MKAWAFTACGAWEAAAALFWSCALTAAAIAIAREIWSGRR